MFVVPKPLSRVLFMQALRMTRAARSRLTGLQSENRRLQKRIEDIRRRKNAVICAIPLKNISYLTRKFFRFFRFYREIPDRL